MLVKDFPIPVVDWTAPKAEKAKQIVEGLETMGFLLLTKVPDVDYAEVRRLSEWFFKLPLEQKMKIAPKHHNPKNTHLYRGYSPLNPKATSAYKEIFEMGMLKNLDASGKSKLQLAFEEESSWLSDEDVPGAAEFREGLEKHAKRMQELGRELVSLMCAGCGVKEDWFEGLFFPDHLSTQRVLHYESRPYLPEGTLTEDGRPLLCDVHTDSTFVTLLLTFEFAGLEVMDPSGRWLSMPATPESIVMNIGDMLSWMSAGRFRATPHRVIDTKEHRYSSPFFLEPQFNSDVGVKMFGKRGPEVKYGPFVASKMSSVYTEYEGLVGLMKDEEKLDFKTINEQLKANTYENSSGA